MKIKTFKFLMSNMARRDTIKIENGDPDAKLNGYEINANKYQPVATAKEIDDTINKFIKKIDVVNILINDFSVSHHNNGYGDTIERTYTIMYN